MNVRISILLVLLAAIILSACSLLNPETATPEAPEPEAVYTSAAMTAFAGLTEQASAPTETGTPTPPSPTETPGPSETPTTTETATPFHSGGEDKAIFIEDVTIPDGTTVEVGEAFVKTWRLQNGGTSTWNPGYKVLFAGGVQMGGPDEQNLTEEVPPGGFVDISVPLIAPDGLGLQRGDWVLMNSLGERFGIGAGGNEAFYLLVNVVSAGSQSGETPTPGPTTSGDPITDLTISVSEESFTGECPHTFLFNVAVTAGQPTRVTLALEAGAEDPSYAFNLPGPSNHALAVGTSTFQYTLNLNGSVEGWVQVRLSGPFLMNSNQARFSLTCE